MLRIAYHTLGCKVNQYETEKIRESLENAGFTIVPFESAADCYVVNTCTVTRVADSKSRAAVRKALRANADAYVVVTGCYAEIEPGQVQQMEGVDLVVPNEEKDAIAERLIARFKASGQLPANADPPTARPRLRTRAIVKVQDGCDQFCAYCVVPFARSKKSSRPLKEVLAELQVLASCGYKEVVLTGIRLGSYESNGARLPDLISAANEISGIQRIRLSSVEPWEVDGSLLAAMRLPKVCRHLHIPLQSGDDGVLRGMGRPYTAERYLEILAGVREAIPGIGLTTDVIAGFPGESESAFENTARVIQAAAFSRLHVFRYSRRERTAASMLPDQVDQEIKKKRADELGRLGALAVRDFARSLVGDAVEVLVENRHRSIKHLRGYADNYAEVVFPGSESLCGEIVRVRINDVDEGGRAHGTVECKLQNSEPGGMDCV